jgi:transcriptional regulator with XRE-family HTH domain
MSQRELAAKAGISREYVTRLEAARQDPTLGTLENIALKSSIIHHEKQPTQGFTEPFRFRAW